MSDTSNPPQSDTTSNSELIEKLENTPGTMVLLPTPGTSGHRNTLVRIPLKRLENLIAQEANKARINELETVLKNCPMPTLSYEDIETRIATLKAQNRSNDE